MKSKWAFALHELLVVVAVVMGLLMFLLPRIHHGHREPAWRVVCSSQLSGIGRSLALYLNDYNDCYPVTWPIGGNNGSFGMGLYNEPDEWGFTRWADPCWSGWNAEPTAGSCLFLLIKYEDLIPEMFHCPEAPDDVEMEFEIAGNVCKEKGWPAPESWRDLNDFQSMHHLSYSYNDPWQFPLRGDSPSDMPVMADKSPAYDTATGGLTPNIGIGPDGEQSGNSRNHEGTLQNVLFIGSNVGREYNPRAGIGGDNMYTRWSDASDADDAAKIGLGRWDKGHAAAANDAYLGN